MEYLNFDIRVRPSDDRRYLVWAESEGHGEARCELVLDLDAGDFAAELERLAERQTDRKALEKLGRELFERLFADGVETLFQRSYGAVERRRDLGLRLRLRMTPPELAALPWELLYSQADGRFLGTRVDSPVVRYLELPRVIHELATRLPLRLLVAIPRGDERFPEVSVEAETEIIDQALAALGRDAEVVYLHQRFDDRRVTWTRLAESLAESPFHCFHFVGHGSFQRGRGHLVLDGDDGRAEIVDDATFAELFVNHPSMRLVLLNACGSATLSTSEPLEGCAASLVEKGLPAVVAMQFSILDKAAVNFARSFYHSLFRSAEKGRVDVAVSRGRHVLATRHRAQREFASPVLFMRAPNGVLFVPESGRRVRDLPLTTPRIHTLLAAREATGSDDERARFDHRIRVAKRAAQVGLATALFAFALFWIGLLDFFTLDTRAEFLVMAVGDAWWPPEWSDELEVVAIDGADLDLSDTADLAALRAEEARVIGELAAAGARVVVFAGYFGVTADGDFSRLTAADATLATAIESSDPTVVVLGSQSLRDDVLRLPTALAAAGARAGHPCDERKLGLTRSLPLAVVKSESSRIVPSRALVALAAFSDGELLGLAEAAGHPAVIRAPGVPDRRLGISERRSVRGLPAGRCRPIERGDQVAHRFVRLSPAARLSDRVLAAELPLPQSRLAGRVVVLGVADGTHEVRDLAGHRAGYLWQADALNNLLLDLEAVPLRDRWQLLIMVLLAGASGFARLRWGERRLVGPALVTGVSGLFLLATVCLYGRFGILINPGYHLVALWLAWWLAGKAGRTWLG